MFNLLRAGKGDLGWLCWQLVVGTGTWRLMLAPM